MLAVLPWGLSWGELAIVIVILAGVIALVRVGLKRLGVTIPEWVIEVFWIIVVVFVIVLAIRIVMAM